jgi:hypothetical protein
LEGRFRGTSGISQRREIPSTCRELASKGADLIIFLRDANTENWREVLRADCGRCPSEHSHLTVFGVCDRNVECWICADAAWIANETNRQPADFRVADPKSVFEKSMGSTARDRKEKEIADLIREAPLGNWLTNRSFEDFYDKLWQRSKNLGCAIENLRDRK